MSYKLAFLTLCSTPQPCSRVSTHLKSGSSTFIQAAASARGKGPSTLSEDGEGWGRSCHPPWGEVFVLNNVPRTASRSSRLLPCSFISRSSMRLLFKVSPRSRGLWWWGRNSEAPFGSGSGQPFPSNTGLWYHLHSRIHLFGASLVVQMVKNPPAMQETRV